MSHGDDSAEPKRNGCTRDPPLDTTNGDEEILNPLTKVLHLRQIISEGSNGTERARPSPPTKSSKEGMVNSSKRQSGTEGFCALATKSERNKIVQDLQPCE